MKVGFKEAVLNCFDNKVFLQEYDRVNKTNLSKRLSIIENLIDEETGLRDKELVGFIKFVDEFVWKPLLDNKKNIVEEKL